jgi:hypothetical protein
VGVEGRTHDAPEEARVYGGPHDAIPVHAHHPRRSACVKQLGFLLASGTVWRYRGLSRLFTLHPHFVFALVFAFHSFLCYFI